MYEPDKRSLAFGKILAPATTEAGPLPATTACSDVTRRRCVRGKATHRLPLHGSLQAVSVHPRQGRRATPASTRRLQEESGLLQFDNAMDPLCSSRIPSLAAKDEVGLAIFVGPVSADWDARVRNLGIRKGKSSQSVLACLAIHVFVAVSAEPQAAAVLAIFQFQTDKLQVFCFHNCLRYQ